MIGDELIFFALKPWSGDCMAFVLLLFVCILFLQKRLGNDA